MRTRSPQGIRVSRTLWHQAREDCVKVPLSVMNVNWTSQAFPMMNMRAPSRDDFPTVILDANATQKFAEIEVQWGESSGIANDFGIPACTTHFVFESFVTPSVESMSRVRMDQPHRGKGFGKFLGNSSKIPLVIVFFPEAGEVRFDFATLTFSGSPRQESCRRNARRVFASRLSTRSAYSNYFVLSEHPCV